MVTVTLVSLILQGFHLSSGNCCVLFTSYRFSEPHVNIMCLAKWISLTFLSVHFWSLSYFKVSMSLFLENTCSKAQRGDEVGKSTLAIQVPPLLTNILFQAVRTNWEKENTLEQRKEEKGTGETVQDHGGRGSWHLPCVCVFWKWKVHSQGVQGTAGLGWW